LSNTHAGLNVAEYGWLVEEAIGKDTFSQGITTAKKLGAFFFANLNILNLKIHCMNLCVLIFKLRLKNCVKI
jgi:hypothetical protein